MRYSTAILKITWPCKNQGKFVIVGAVPGSCVDATGKSLAFSTQDAALSAIMADKWIKATPSQPIQLADCTFVSR